ncbi:YggT family protein [Metabacillus litoralis]|uniref:YggT family protein n=1 Tax=Metabacillus litoralis TaxID=152268 RepID=A0A5C6W6G7_9BACI|nr:YggT family protein [Metabacillus litoralis]TXC92037.1 YggT family protein [Metabacillus litoralis]
MDFLYSIISTVLSIYSYAIIVYILLSWFPGARESSFGGLLAKIVEPYLEPFRKIIPPLGMIDLSPIVAILALMFAQYGVASIFNMIG